MTQSESKAPRQFSVTKDNGELWWMLYTSRGIKWERQQGQAAVGVTPGSPSSKPPAGRMGGAIGLMEAASGPLGAVAAVIDSVASVLGWWESRQYRLIDQARFEEERRIPWTADMMARWVKAHEGGGHLDLRISSYLAREATATMNALVADKRMAVPQALLYDLELIREALSATRRLYSEQFGVFALDTDGDVSHALHSAVPHARLNLDFIARLTEDPSLEWSRRVRDRASKAFDDDLREATRHQELFMHRLFTSTEISRREGEMLDQGFVEKILSRVNVVPSLPAMVTEQIRGDGTVRRDDYRELALFASEASRVSALHTAWGVVDTAVRDQVGAGILVSEVGGATRLSLPPAASTPIRSLPALES